MKPLGTLKEFSKILRETIIPYLREDGFKGSVPTFRWISSPIIQVVNFQGSSCSAACYVNIGMHLDFLPVNRMGEMIDPKKFNEYHCLFRKRMSWQGLLPYEEKWAYTRESAEKMVRYYLSETRPFLLHFRRFPEDFLLASPEDFLWHPVDMAEIYANISKYIGDKHTAQQFFEFAERLRQQEKEAEKNV